MTLGSAVQGTVLQTSSALQSNALVALLAAAAWGAGDFAGGMGVKVSGGGTSASLRLICVAHAASLIVLLVVYGLSGGALPHGRAVLLGPVLWALLAGAIAGLSIAAFYLALARGAMGASAALSGLLAAAIPAAASSFLEGRPSLLQIGGFALAGLAIWLIAAGPGAPPKDSAADGLPASKVQPKRGTTALAVLGGLGFGVYFLLLRLANPLGVLAPVALARMGSLTACLTLLMVLGSRPGSLQGPQPTAKTLVLAHVLPRPLFGLTPPALRWALGVALMDTGGNLLFIAATRLGRLDVASVLASLYPAGTILLAAIYLHERPTRQQLAGMGLALAAVVLVTI